jgi:hypothetical protein
MDNPMTTETVACRLCRCEQTITAPVAGFLAWQNGEYIQDAFPMMSAGDREMLISQTCDNCWTEMFGEPEDEFEENWINN